MGATLQTVSNITKQVYGPRIVNQVNNEVVLTRRIEKTSKRTESTANGKVVKIPIKTRRNQGLGYRNELEKLQAPGQQGYNEITVPLRYGYGRVHLSGPAIELVNENANAFTSVITEEMNGLKTDIVKDTNRILWGNGLGVLATVDTAATSNTISVGTDATSVKWFGIDMQVDILSADGQTVIAADRKVTAINEATGDITISGAAVTVAVGQIITRQGNYAREPQGFSSLIKASGVVQGLDAANEPLWKSHENNTGGALSESAMIEMVDRIVAKGGRPTVLFTDLGTRRAYFNLLKSERRFTNTQKFEGGFSGLAFTYDTDIPMVTDIDAPTGKIWFVDESAFTVYHRKDWSWDDRDGSTWKWVTDYDAYEALMKKYWEFAIERRNTSGVMTGITPG